MSVRTEIRKAVTETPGVMAAVGATEVAVERVRKVAADAGQLPGELESRVSKWQLEVEKAVGSIDPAYLQKFLAKTFDAKTLQSGVKEVPALALARALEVAGRVETRFEDLTDRGKKRLQGLGGVAEKAAPVKDAATATAAGAAQGLRDVAGEVEQAVAGGAKGTRAAAKRTATTTRKRAAAKITKAAKVAEVPEASAPAEPAEPTEG